MMALWWGALTAWAEPLEFSGWVQPTVTATVAPQALPVDRFDAGVRHSRAGVRWDGEPVEDWSTVVYLVVGDHVQVLTGASVIDQNNDGASDGIATSVGTAVESVVEETSITWSPVDAFGIRVGRLRIPFSAQAMRIDTELLFPDRSDVVDRFNGGSDYGAIAGLSVLERRLQAQAGLFNDDGWGAATMAARGERGVLYGGRVDAALIGTVPEEMLTLVPSGLHVALGAGVLFHPYRRFDDAGEADVAVDADRATASLQIVFEGVSLSGEVLRGVVKDSLTSRPLQESGAYAQVGWLVPMGLQPIAQVELLRTSETFDPRLTRWIRGGLTVYPYAKREVVPDVVRVTFLYEHEDQVTVGEASHAGEVAFRLRW